MAACAVCASAEDFTPDDESYMDAMASVVKAVAYPAIKYGKLWGNSYKGKKYKTYSKDDIINSLTNQLCLQNAVAGAGGALAAQSATVASAGLAVPAVMAGQVSAGLTASISLQISLVAAVAVARGFDEDDPRFDQMVFYVIAGDALTEGVKAVAGTAASKSFEKFIFSGIGEHVKMLNGVMWRIVGQKFMTINAKHAASSGMVNLASLVPGVGAAVAFVADGGMCKYTAQYMDWQVFEGSYRDKKALELWLEDGLKISDEESRGIVEEGWDWGSLCEMSERDVNDLVGIGKLRKGPSKKLLSGLRNLTHCSDTPPRDI